MSPSDRSLITLMKLSFSPVRDTCDLASFKAGTFYPTCYNVCVVLICRFWLWARRDCIAVKRQQRPEAILLRTCAIIISLLIELINILMIFVRYECSFDCSILECFECRFYFLYSILFHPASCRRLPLTRLLLCDFWIQRSINNCLKSFCGFSHSTFYWLFSLLSACIFFSCEINVVRNIILSFWEDWSLWKHNVPYYLRIHHIAMLFALLIDIGSVHLNK